MDVYCIKALYSSHWSFEPDRNDRPGTLIFSFCLDVDSFVFSHGKAYCTEVHLYQDGKEHCGYLYALTQAPYTSNIQEVSGGQFLAGLVQVHHLSNGIDSASDSAEIKTETHVYLSTATFHVHVLTTPGRERYAMWPSHLLCL